MNSNRLLTYIATSSVRKNILYQLLEEPMDLAGLKSVFGVTSADLLPRLKDLEKRSLLYKVDGVYQLTFTGRAMARILFQWERLSRLLEEHGQFLNSHDMSVFPENLQNSMNMLGDCRIIQNNMRDINATYREIVEKLSMSSSLKGISPIFDAHFPEVIVSIALRNAPTSIILTRDIYEIVAEKYEDALRAFLSCENARLYVVEEARLALAVTDSFLSVSLYHKDGGFDAQTNLMSFEESALKWGEELFEYYRRQSKEVKST